MPPFARSLTARGGPITTTEASSASAGPWYARLERAIRAGARAALGDVTPAPPGQAVAAAEALAVRNVPFHVGAPSAALGHRLVVHATYTLHGDEQRDGVCAVAVSVANGGVVAGFGALAARALPRPANDEPPASALHAAARAAHAACRSAAEEAAAEFREDVQRRRAREQERLEAHFQHLLLLVKADAQRGCASPEEALARRRALERERAAELEAVWQRYEVRIDTSPVAAVVVEAPVTRVSLELCRRNASRIVVVELDAATRALVTPPCDGCGGDAPRPAACHDAMHLLCERCAPSGEGRIACSACRAPRARRTGFEAA